MSVIPEQNDVIIDFSMCEFVDHSVMENLNDYQELFHKKGGNIEIIGMDMLDAKSEHPFALRRLLPIPGLMNNSKTKRQKDLELDCLNFALCVSNFHQVTTSCILKIILLLGFSKARGIFGNWK